MLKNQDYIKMSSKTPKILFVSNTANFQKFNLPFMRWCKSQNWQVDYASAGEEKIKECDNEFKIDMSRSPFTIKNVKAIWQMKKILKENNYNIIHCHTPMGSVVARLAGRGFRKNGLKIIYTAHGFHFYKGAPKLNWMLFYPIERALSKVTDILICINKEDYELVLLKKFKAKRILMMDGVGVDINRFTQMTQKEKSQIRKSFQYLESDYIIIYVAEFISRKNHRFFVENIPALRKQIPNMKVIFAGKGLLIDEIQELASELKVDDIIWFTGYRNDIDRLSGIADLYVTTSKQEGLPISVIEALALGLPIVASNIRGHTDIVLPKYNGDLFELGNCKDFIDKILCFYKDPELCKKISVNNINDASRYAVSTAVEKMSDVYKSCLQ